MKNIIVTGGSRGIGKSIVKCLLAEGYLVHTCSRNSGDLIKLETELDNRNLQTFVLDLSDREAISTFCSRWNEPLYGLVNNSGICATEYLNEDLPGNWDRVLNTNLHGPYFLTKGLLPHLEDYGRIINISSQLGKDGRAGYSAYCASKFALIGLTKTWAYELGQRGITVNAICPGWVKTEMAETDLVRAASELRIGTDALYNRICSQLELKRFQDPSEIANLTSFLLSEKASGISGRDWLLSVIWNQD